MKTNLLKGIAAMLVTGAVLVLFGLAVARSNGGDSQDADQTDRIVGTWNCTVPANTSPCLAPDCFNVIKNFHAGGTMVEMDNLNSPSQESIVLGDWTRTGRRTYLAEL